MKVLILTKSKIFSLISFSFIHLTIGILNLPIAIANDLPDWKRHNYTEISLENNCRKTKINAAIRYQDLDGDWVTKGWYSFKAGEKSYLADTRNDYFFVYGNSYGFWDSGRIWDGDYYYSVRGSQETYGFNKVRMEGGVYIDGLHALTLESLKKVAGYNARSEIPKKKFTFRFNCS